MRLSKNLTLAEVIKSQTAIRKGIDNYPSPEHLANLELIAENIFQPCRDEFGPLCISSGYRSEELNKAIGGSRTSQHSKGQALDIDGDMTGVHNGALFNFILANLDFDQLIWEFGDGFAPDWVHVSYKKQGNRKQALIAKKVNGKTKYFQWD